MAKKLTIFGSTGSIGKSTLAIVDACPGMFEIHALVAGKNQSGLAAQALKYKPAFVGIADNEAAKDLESALVGSGITVVAGEAACTALARDPVDVVVAGIVGLAGLPAVLAAAEAGQTIALANKESLVSAGAIVTRVASQNGARILPVDSEHSAIFQCWLGWAGHAVSGALPSGTLPTDTANGAGSRSAISHICLTASGGPFREMELREMDTVTPAQAVKHPNWSMGRKISVDSATMMNKGLEVIEAAWLFDLPADRIEVLVHPQVVVHGLVYFRDGSVIAQLGTADMKTPISYALAWPDRLEWDPEPIDLAAIGRMEFTPVDPQRYPCFELARAALEAGGGTPAILNAANEIAVAAFLEGQIGFSDIAKAVSRCLDTLPAGQIDTAAMVFDLDAAARHVATEICLEMRA